MTLINITFKGLLAQKVRVELLIGDWIKQKLLDIINIKTNFPIAVFVPLEPEQRFTWAGVLYNEVPTPVKLPFVILRKYDIQNTCTFPLEVLIDLLPPTQVRQIFEIHPKRLASRIAIKNRNILGYLREVWAFRLLLVLNVVVRPPELLLKLVFLLGVVIRVLLFWMVVFWVRGRVLWGSIRVVVVGIFIVPTTVSIEFEDEAAGFDGESGAIGEFGVDLESVGLWWVFGRHNDILAFIINIFIIYRLWSQFVKGDQRDTV